MSIAFLIIFLINSCHSTLWCSICLQEMLLTSPINCELCKNRLDFHTCSIDDPKCDPNYKYRSYNGSCNNLDYPTMGQELTVYQRVLPAEYNDGISQIRRSASGNRLPLERTIRTTLFSDFNKTDEITLNVMVWGHIVAHDLALSKAQAIDEDCCSPKMKREQSICAPLHVPPDDYFFSQYNLTCISKHRRRFALIGDCDPNQPMQQYNQVSHTLDGSVIYGSNLQSATTIRLHRRGKLQVQLTKDRRVFPPNLPYEEGKKKCLMDNNLQSCYNAGDPRINQLADIAVLHTIFLREHNRLAVELHSLHTDWTDEVIFQETRAILIAIYQHITYNDFLPLLIGDLTMKKHKLYPLKEGYTKYNSSINMATINSFTAAAFRMGHTIIPESFELYNYNKEIVNELNISNLQLKPNIIQENDNFDQFLLGFTIQKIQAFDNYFTEQMTNKHFAQFKPFLQDLVAADISQGRGNGLPAYIKYLEICTGLRPPNFLALTKFISRDHVIKLSKLYRSVKDIDLFVGAAFEAKVHGSKFGPTFLCIITEEFYRKKWGDRFWYEVEEQPHSFTPDQLGEIRKMTLGRLICNNGDNITEITRNSFLPPSQSNRFVACNSIPALDITKWA